MSPWKHCCDYHISTLSSLSSSCCPIYLRFDAWCFIKYIKKFSKKIPVNQHVLYHGLFIVIQAYVATLIGMVDVYLNLATYGVFWNSPKDNWDRLCKISILIYWPCSLVFVQHKVTFAEYCLQCRYSVWFVDKKIMKIYMKCCYSKILTEYVPYEGHSFVILFSVDESLTLCEFIGTFRKSQFWIKISGIGLFCTFKTATWEELNAVSMCAVFIMPSTIHHR